jgi:hypothetical protein
MCERGKRVNMHCIGGVQLVSLALAHLGWEDSGLW